MLLDQLIMEHRGDAEAIDLFYRYSRVFNPESTKQSLMHEIENIPEEHIKGFCQVCLAGVLMFRAACIGEANPED